MKSIAIVVLLAALCAPQRCPGGEEAESSGGSAGGKRAYSLQEVILMALDANLEIEVERRGPLIREERIEAATGVTDPTLTVRAVYENLERVQNTTEFFATDESALFEEENVLLQSGVTGLLPSGTTYELLLNANRLENTLNARTISRFRPEYDSDIAISLTQPLLRGFGVDVTMTEVRIAESDLTISQHELRRKILNVVVEVMNTYVELIFAQDNIAVSRDAIELSENLKKENERRVELGVMQPIDVVQAEAAVSEASEELIRAETYFVERQNGLKRLVFADFGKVRGLEIEAADRLSVTPPDLGDWEALYAKAIAHNPEYLRQREASQQEELRFRFAKNQVLPRVDLRATAGWNGLGDDYSNSLNSFRNRRGPEWSAGVIVSFPWSNREAKARLAESRLRLEQADLTVRYTANEVAAALDTAVKQVEAHRRRIAMTKKSVELASEALRREEKRLDSGLTTSYNVLGTQKELSEARSRQLAATADLKKAVTGMWRIVGRIPELDNHVRFKFENGATKE